MQRPRARGRRERLRRLLQCCPGCGDQVFAGLGPEAAPGHTFAKGGVTQDRLGHRHALFLAAAGDD